MLAHVYQGGTMVYEQHPVGDGHYAYSHIAIDVRLREFMVKDSSRITFDHGRDRMSRLLPHSTIAGAGSGHAALGTP